MKNKKKHHINTFAAVDGVLLFVLSLICLLPIINVLAISFSSRAAADAGRVALWPVEFTTAAYRYVLDDQQFLKSLSVSVMRVLTGPALNLLLCILSLLFQAFRLCAASRHSEGKTQRRGQGR